MNSKFFQRFFNNLVESYIELNRKKIKLNKKKSKKILKEKEELKENKSWGEFNKIERIKERKQPIIVRKFPKIDLDKISDISLKSTDLMNKINLNEQNTIPLPGEKERFLPSLNRFKYINEGLIPSIEITEEENESNAMKKGFDFGKLGEVLHLKNIDKVQCIEGEPVIIRYTNGKVETSSISLSRDEIYGIVKEISERTKIPIEKKFEAYIDEFFVQAEINDKLKLVVNRII